MFEQRLSFETDAQDEEQWYWHSLYFTDWIEAIEAKKCIKQALDACCDVRVARNQYVVEFSTSYRFTPDDIHALAQVISPKVVERATFNEAGEDEENPLCWPGPEEELEINPKRTRMTHGLCTLCGSRTSYGLWCAKCKRSYLKSGIEFVDEPDPCPFCNTPLDRGHSHRATLENDLQYLINIIRATLLGVIALPVILIGLLAGLVLWLFEDP